MGFKERLRELRTERGLFQKDLAKKLNITDDCVGNWERGNSEPSITQLIQIAKLFDVSVDFLLGVSEY